MGTNKTPQMLERIHKVVSDRKVLSAEIHSLWDQIVKLRGKRANLSTSIKQQFAELKAYHASRKGEREGEKLARAEARKAKVTAAKQAKAAEKLAKKAAKAAAATVTPPAVPA